MDNPGKIPSLISVFTSYTVDEFAYLFKYIIRMNRCVGCDITKNHFKLHFFRRKVFLHDPARAFLSLGPSTITTTTFFSLILKAPSRFAECFGYFQTVRLLIYYFILSSKSNATYIHTAQVICSLFTISITNFNSL